jgi:hypothetical protein
LENNARELMFSLPACPQPLVLRHVLKDTNASASDPEVFMIDANGFANEASARDFGVRLKMTLSICSARLGLGFNVGEDRATSGLGSGIRQELRASYGIDIRPTVHGLDVFDTSVPFTRFQVRGMISITRPLRNFPERITADFKDWTLSEKHTLALSLYNASHYEVDSEARFLSLISVVEVLANRKRRSRPVIAFLRACIENLEEQDKLSPSELVALRDGLGNLKRESISEACRSLVQSARGDVGFIHDCYKARSELLHDGRSTTHPELPSRPHVLDELVRKVLIWAIEGDGP